jgi:hypothetical protein
VFPEGSFPGIGRGGGLPGSRRVDVYPAGTMLWSRAVTSEAERLRQARYKRSAKGKATEARYRQSEKGKAANSRYWRSEKGKAAAKRKRARRKERSAAASRP